MISATGDCASLISAQTCTPSPRPPDVAELTVHLRARASAAVNATAITDALQRLWTDPNGSDCLGSVNLASAPVTTLPSSGGDSDLRGEGDSDQSHEIPLAWIFLGVGMLVTVVGGCMLAKERGVFGKKPKGMKGVEQAGRGTNIRESGDVQLTSSSATAQ